MKNLDKYKQDRIKEIEKMKLNKAIEEISLTVHKCKYCKYHKRKVCIRGVTENYICMDGIREYLEKESV